MLSEFDDYKNDDQFYDDMSIKSESTIKDNFEESDDDLDFDIISNYDSSIYNLDKQKQKQKILDYLKEENKERTIVKNLNLKHNYTVIKYIADKLRIQFNGNIFGGFVRDTLLHNHGAYKYYEEYSKYINSNRFVIKNKKYNKTSSIHIYQDENIFYNNKNFHNESYLDRNTIPSDIDIVLHDNDFKHLINYLNEKFTYLYSCKKHENFNEYMKINDHDAKISSFYTIFIHFDNPLNDLKKKVTFHEYLSFDLRMINNQFKTVKVKIQIFTCKEDISKKSVLDILTNGSDFFCNALYYDIDNKINMSLKNMTIIENKIFHSTYNDNIKKKLDIFLQRNLFKKEILDKVINQIFERKAIPINEKELMYKRIKKMKKKNFKIFCITKYFSKSILNNDNEICMYCRDNIICNELISMKCCNSFYHKECMIEICSNIKYRNKIYPCFMCKTNVDFKYVRKYINI